MTRTKLGSLGLCALLLGLMAFSAPAAQGEKGAQWLLGEKGEGTNLIPFLEAEVELENEGSVYVTHTEILKVKTLYLCTSLKIAGNPKLQSEGRISSGKVLFSGCTTELNGTPNANCTPKDAGEGVAGTVVSKSVHGLIVLHEGQDIIKLLPDEGETYGTVEMGAACPIGTKVPLIGSLALKCAEGMALTHLVKHLLEGFEPLTELWSISKTTEHKSSALGTTWLFLKGEHVGLKFSWDPA